MSSSEFGVSIDSAWLWEACLLMLRAVFLLCWRICVNTFVSCSGTCWLLGGAWFQYSYGRFWMSSCLLMFPEISSLRFSSFGIKPSAFSLILIVASRLLHPYSTDDKTSRLMVKQFSTARDTQRGSQSYTEKRRGWREIEVTRRRRGGVKKGEISLASDQFPKCSAKPGTPRQIHRD